MNITKVWQSDGEAGIKQTLRRMQELVISSDANRVIKQKAREIILKLSPTDELGQIQAIFRWVQQNLMYVRDIYGVEEITSPDKIVHSVINGLNQHSSDCDDFAILLSALLRAVGFRTRIEALAINQADGYDHARAAVFVKTLNKWWPLEGTKSAVEAGYGLPSKMTILAMEVY